MFSQPTITDKTITLPGTRSQLTVRLLMPEDPIAGGNKWFKLKYNLMRARESGCTRLVTFGGAFSNHIAATARAGKEGGFKTTGIIRGEPASASNITLQRAASDGMELIFISRSEYRNRYDPAFGNTLLPETESCYFIPEGGSNEEGVKGCSEILGAGDERFGVITVCAGTGATASGMSMSLHQGQQLTVFSVLKDGGELGKINYSRSDQVNIIRDFHFGGYAKVKPELLDFCSHFSESTGITIEPIYTGKMFYGIREMIRNELLDPAKNILAIHTGGLQYLL